MVRYYILISLSRFAGSVVRAANDTSPLLLEGIAEFTGAHSYKVKSYYAWPVIWPRFILHQYWTEFSFLLLGGIAEFTSSHSYHCCHIDHSLVTKSTLLLHLLSIPSSTLHIKWLRSGTEGQLIIECQIYHTAAEQSQKNNHTPVIR